MPPNEPPQEGEGPTRRRLLAAVGSVAGLGALAGCNGFIFDRETETVSRTFSAEDISTLAVDEATDSVTVRSHDGADVDVTVEKTAFGQTNSADLELRSAVEGDTLRLSTHVPDSVGTGGGSIGLTVRVPDDVVVDRVLTRDGSVTVEGVRGEVRVRTNDGSIDLGSVTGSAALETEDGSITADAVSGDLEATTTDGSLTVDEVGGSLTASTMDGSITVSDVEGDADVETQDGSITVSSVGGVVAAETLEGSINVSGAGGIDEVSTGDGSINVDVYAIRDEATVETTEGSLTATLGPDLDATVEATVTDGSIEGVDALDSVDTRSETALHGAVGDGTNELRLRTVDGSITLRRGS